MDLTFAVIGPGAVGAVLIRSLRQAGLTVGAVFGRNDELETPAEINVVAICTPDDVVQTVAESLASSGISWTDRIVFHVSGVLTSDILAPLADTGASTLSFHPLTSIPAGSTARTLENVTIAVEGSDSEAVDTMIAVARRLGAHPISVNAGQKAAYHLAASMASNFLVMLGASVQDVLRAADLDIHLMDGLVEDTLANLRTRPAPDVLTGPIVRGDVTTVRMHLDTLQALAPHLTQLYTIAAKSTLNKALENGRIDDSQFYSISELLK